MQYITYRELVELIGAADAAMIAMVQPAMAHRTTEDGRIVCIIPQAQGYVVAEAWQR